VQKKKGSGDEVVRKLAGVRGKGNKGDKSWLETLSKRKMKDIHLSPGESGQSERTKGEHWAKRDGGRIAGGRGKHIGLLSDRGSGSY